MVHQTTLVAAALIMYSATQHVTLFAALLISVRNLLNYRDFHLTPDAIIPVCKTGEK